MNFGYFLKKNNFSQLSKNPNCSTNFCDFLINVGMKYGAVKSKDLLYGRRAVKNAALEESLKIEEKLKNQIKGKSVCFTSDLWSSKYSNDSFLDVHMV